MRVTRSLVGGVALLASLSCSRPHSSLKAPEPEDAGAAKAEKPAPPPPAREEPPPPGDKAARPKEATPLVPLESLEVSDELKAALRKLNGPHEEDEIRDLFDGLKDKGAVDALMKALHAQEPNVRSLSAFVLRRMKVQTPELTAELKHLLLSDPDPDVRGVIARNLVFYADKETVPAIIEALQKDEVEAVRMHCAWALGDLGDPRGVGPLVQALDDKETDVRLRAVNSLQRLKARAAIQPLIARLDDANLMVRGRAREALVSITGKDLGHKADAWRSAYPAEK